MGARFSFDLKCVLLYISVLLLLVFLLKYVWNKRFLYYYGSKISGPFALPLIGSAYYFTGGAKVLYDKLWQICEKYQPLAKIWLGPHLMVIPSHPKDVEYLLHNFVSKGQLYEYITPLFGHGLLTGTVEKWKDHRKLINASFNSKILNSFIDIFVTHAKSSLDVFKEFCGKGQVDILPVFLRINIDGICETAMGVKPGTLSDRYDYLDWMMRAEHLIMVRMFRPWLYPDFIWKNTNMGKEQKQLCKKSWKFIANIIKQKRGEKINTLHNDLKKLSFLEYFIDLTDEQQKWCEKELIEEAQTMVFTGSGSLAITECYVLLMLAIHPEIQEKIYEELLTIFGNSDRDLCFKDLSKLCYLDRVIKETLRLFPIAPYIARLLDSDIHMVILDRTVGIFDERGARKVTSGIRGIVGTMAS
ncbi:cytochrome P450 4C1 isoform X2 [Tribolium castaneum]|uniref:cytochrome P450 4C1 isoform X2 n=1 Tax=Tribolium castaneum TaxID=7070 RepID=UPI00077DBE6B|nr:PREDICTED: cytochrome P450 4C1 isoform X2 [Tribolium castaneum]|eukprot:XP_015835137.1 PREDICTED: cytochrome P450 4C1 isoform X2 [Tribolium castaneum]